MRILLPLLVLSACAPLRAGPPLEVFHGHYRYGFEMEAFRPCGSTESWWVVRADELRARVPEDSRAEGRVYAVIRARVSEHGDYGHLGAYPRMVSVVHVLEVRERAPEAMECPSSSIPVHSTSKGVR